jgi:hypothetical protein
VRANDDEGRFGFAESPLSVSLPTYRLAYLLLLLLLFFLLLDFFRLLLFFRVDFFLVDFFLVDFFAVDFFRGTLAPFARASERPIAIACSRLFTLG